MYQYDDYDRALVRERWRQQAISQQRHAPPMTK